MGIRKYDKTEWICPYNEAINCNLNDMTNPVVCEGCGWNPREQARRRNNFLKRDNQFKYKIKK